MVDFLVDPRGLPANFIGQKPYADAVNRALQSKFSVADAPTQHSVTGLLLLGEHFDPNASDFNNAVTRFAWDHWQITGITSFISGAPLGVTYTLVSGADITGAAGGTVVMFSGLGDRLKDAAGAIKNCDGSEMLGEVDITSTVGGARSLNARSFAAGKVPGPITQRLIDAYKELVGCDFVAQYLRRLDG